MISFDVVSLFTNVPLERTIEIILRKVYTEKLIKTKIKREDMKELLLLCTQGVPFTFNDETYMQIDGVMMGSPLGALFANIFMCELENTLIPKLQNVVSNWTRYVDDTFAIIEPKNVEMVEKELNSFHNTIKFTHELEQEQKLPFLDVLIKRTETDEIETSVYRKPTNTDIYMNWKSHAPGTWKVATLKSLVKRALLVSSTKSALEHELGHIQHVFSELNDYPPKLVETIIKNERNNFQQKELTLETDEEEPPKEENEEKPVSLMLNLPYAGDEGEKVVSKMRKYISNTVNKVKKKVSVSAVYKASKLGSRFNIKDKIAFKNRHNVVYHAHCPNKKCKSHYVGQTRCRIEKRGDQHRGKDKKSHLVIHAKKTKHKRVSTEDFKIIGSGFRTDFIRKISESLQIRKLKPDLNVQKDSYKLSLFN